MITITTMMASGRLKRFILDQALVAGRCALCLVACAVASSGEMVPSDGLVWGMVIFSSLPSHKLSSRHRRTS